MNDNYLKTVFDELSYEQLRRNQIDGSKEASIVILKLFSGASVLLLIMSYIIVNFISVPKNKMDYLYPMMILIPLVFYILLSVSIYLGLRKNLKNLELMRKLVDQYNIIIREQRGEMSEEEKKKLRMLRIQILNLEEMIFGE
jgi:hypothetical protein